MTDWNNGNNLLPMPAPGADITRGKSRDREAARLKAIGWTLEEIGAHLEFGDDERLVAAAIRRATAQMARFAGDETKLMELRSLDELEYEAWKMLRKGHIMVSHGKVIRNDLGQPMADMEYPLKVLDRIIRVKERRAKMLGLDASTKIEVVTIDVIDAEIAKLEREVLGAS